MGTPELPEANREYEIVIQNRNIPMQELRKKILSIGGKIIKNESIFYHIAYSHPHKKNKDFIRYNDHIKEIFFSFVYF